MTYYEIRERARLLRGVPLESVLMVTGAKRDRHDKAKWHTEQGVLSVTGTKFMNWNQGKGGGGAIDLAMHLNNRGFMDAIDWLYHHFHTPHPTERPPQPRKTTLRLPTKDDRKLYRVRRYLVHERGLAHSLLEPLIESGTIYADNYANAVFLLLGKGNRPVGAELRGTTHRPWRGMAPGSNKDRGYFSVHPDQTQTIVLCESAIDAISCFALQPDRCCISTAGARPNPRWLSELILNGHQVYCGFDLDPTGENMAQAMISLYPSIERCRPSLHDWNDVIMSRL